MEMLSSLRAIDEGNIAVTNGQWWEALLFSLLLARKAAEQAVDMLVIWNAVTLMWRHCDK